MDLMMGAAYLFWEVAGRPSWRKEHGGKGFEAGKFLPLSQA
jgi:hypothetical protein